MKTGARKCRGFESHPLRQLAALIALAVLAGACSVFGPRALHVELPAVGPDSFPLDVALIDQVGLATGLEVLPGDIPGREPLEEGTRVDAIPGRANALALSWIGGACDSVADLLLRGGAEMTVTLSTLTRGGGGCGLVEIPRTVVLVFSQDVDPTSVRFELQP